MPGSILRSWRTLSKEGVTGDHIPGREKPAVAFDIVASCKARALAEASCRASTKACSTTVFSSLRNSGSIERPWTSPWPSTVSELLLGLGDAALHLLGLFEEFAYACHK
jgi:hypothetical protein